MKVVIGNDRKGLDYKNRLASFLEFKGIEIVNVGTDEDVPCDYPIYAEKAARLVANGECDYGILICSSGEGMVMCANKIKGIRSNNNGVSLTVINSDASLKLVFMKTKIDEALSGHFKIIQWNKLMKPSANSSVAAMT